MKSKEDSIKYFSIESQNNSKEVLQWLSKVNENITTIGGNNNSIFIGSTDKFNISIPQSYRLRKFDKINKFTPENYGYSIVYHRISFTNIKNLIAKLYHLDGFTLYSIYIQKLDCLFTLSIRFLCKEEVTHENLNISSNLVILKGLLAYRKRRCFNIKLSLNSNDHKFPIKDRKTICKILTNEDTRMNAIYETLYLLGHKIEIHNQLDETKFKNDYYYLCIDNNKLTLIYVHNQQNHTYIIEDSSDLLYLLGHSHDMVEDILNISSINIPDISTVEVDQELILQMLEENEKLSSFKCSPLGGIYSIEITHENVPKENNSKSLTIIINSTNLTLLNIANVCEEISESLISIERIQHISFGSNQLSSVEVIARINVETDIEKMRKQLFDLSHKIKCDINIEENRVQKKLKRMISFDMKSNIMMEECIDEMAKMAGVTNEVANITKNAMLGNIDFKTALKQRVEYLKGLDSKELFNHVISNIHYTPGAIAICKFFRKLKCEMLLISGGFIQIVNHVKDYLGIQYGYANHLEIDPNTYKLTGGLQDGYDIVDGNMKKNIFEKAMDTHNIISDLTIAVGDGANDVMMLSSSGLGIAFKAKPITQEKSKFHINYVNTLLAIIYIIGISHTEFSNVIFNNNNI